MRKLVLGTALLPVILLVILTTAPAALAQFNPGTVVGNVYQNPAAGYGYGIGYGFGLPQTTPYYGYYRYAPVHRREKAASTPG